MEQELCDAQVADRDDTRTKPDEVKKTPVKRKPTPRKTKPKASEAEMPSKDAVTEDGPKEGGGSDHIGLGRRGEDAAQRFLERRGYEVLERNWTCLAGEADIIAEDDDALVFVEVKTRSNCDKGLPEEAVDARKRSRYEKIAAYYLKDHEFTDKAVRFDVISILVVAPERAFLRHHRDAFTMDA